MDLALLQDIGQLLCFWALIEAVHYCERRPMDRWIPRREHKYDSRYWRQNR